MSSLYYLNIILLTLLFLLRTSRSEKDPNTNAIIPVSSRGAKKIPSLCSEQAVRSHTVNVIARSVATRQSQPFFMRLPRSLCSLAMTIYCKRLPRPFRARNDIVKTYIAFILVGKFGCYIKNTVGYVGNFFTYS